MNKSKNHKPLLLSIIISFQVIAARGTAMVNLHEGSYQYSSADINQNIKRIYKSRSTFQGAFGFGWCAEFETQIRFLRDRKIALFDCSLNDEITYRPNPSKPDEWVADNGSPGDRLLATQGTLLRAQAETGAIQTFNATTGRLIGITDRAGRILELRYSESNQLKEISSQDSPPVQFHYDQASETVSRISQGPKTVIYKYKGLDLTEVSGASRERYHYDDLHNLIRIERNGVILEQVSYDRSLDRVKQVIGQCVDSFTYEATGNRQTSQSFRQCPGRSPRQKKYSFWFTQLKNDKRILEHLRVETDSEITDVHFHPERGLAASVQRTSAIQFPFRGKQ